VTICPTCGEQNPERARFCLSCGRPIAPGSERGGEERKTVTVLFCDLVGFTARSDRADPEDVKATLRPFHAELKGVTEHYQGTVDKFVGDAVIGVFGAPTSHKDDPERGVRAALSINEAIAELNERDATPRLEARIGLATGEAVVAVGAPATLDGESVSGDVVTLATRSG
jgi:class 3 adenylate cyclase